MWSLLRAILSPVSAPSLKVRRGAMGDAPRAEGGWRLRGSPREQDLVADSARPLVTVVTVCFRSARTIADTIAGVRRQTYSPIEYVIIDGGSDDGTLDVLRANEDLIAHWRSEPDGGIYDAFNKGIALARGEFVQIINSDDWLEPEQIERAVATALRDGVDLVHGDIWLHGWKGQDLRCGGDPLWTTRVARTMPSIHQATVLCRRSVYERVGLFRTDLRIASDYDWFIRVAKAGVTTAHDSTVVAHMRAGGASTTRQRRTIAEGFACAYGNGDALLPSLRHWSGRFVWPNGKPAWVGRIADRFRAASRAFGDARTSMRRRAMALANRIPMLRSVPGRGFAKQALGMRSPVVAVATTDSAVRIEDFLAVRDMGHGLPETSIERLLRDATSMSPVVLADSSPIAAQAAEAMRRGGASVRNSDIAEPVNFDGCRAAIVPDTPEDLRRCSEVPVIVALGPERCRIVTGDQGLRGER